MIKKISVFNVIQFTLLVAVTAPFLLINACKPAIDAEEVRIDSIISVLTLEEKINMLHRNSMFSSAGIERLGIPELTCADGPSGVREELERNSWNSLKLTTDSATFFPTGTALAATWNTEMAFKNGVGLGEEAWLRGKNIILGPGINITRTPLNGRTYEYMSEDPFLNSKLAVGYIKGVQSAGVAACVKHFALNNQEIRRGDVSVIADERTVREIYMPAFKASVVEADAKCIMSAYNKFRGQYCGENEYLLNTLLKGEWGFKGIVMSDWGGTHSTVDAALNGLDIEMGTDRYFAQALLDSVNSGKVPMSVIDDKVRRVLRVILFCQKTKPAPANSLVATPEHGRIAYDVASQSIVLLKNDSKLLPLSANSIKKIAVIGDNATHKQQSGGWGAGVKARYEISPLAGLQNKLGNNISIEFAQGFEPNYIESKDGHDKYADNTPNAKLIAEAVEAAKRADVAIIMGGTNREYESEGMDRTDLTLPFGQNELIKAVLAANPRTIVVIVAGAPADMHEVDRIAPAILYAWFNGSEAGNALADVLFGDVNPSGKLPLTFPAKISDSPAHAMNAYPGDSTVTYSEGILVGYRWFDTKNIKPTYCFGYGLSYTEFNYSGLTTDNSEYQSGDMIKVALKLKNTGDAEGSEVVQLYVGDMEPKVLKADKELKAFKKIPLAKGDETLVNLELNASDLSYFDESQMKWVLSPGKYKILVGSSSQDIREELVITIK